MTARPEPPVPPQGRPGASCHACEAPLATDQRYCLECGARRGDGGPLDFAGLLSHPWPARAAVPTTPRRRVLGFPAPVAATMLVTVLFAGFLLGSLGSPSSSGAAAAGVDIVLPPPAAPPPPPAPIATPEVPAVEEPAEETTDAAPVDDTSSADADSTDDSADSNSDDTTTGGEEDDEAKLKHVFVIMLGEQGQRSAFETGSAAPHLSGELVPEGTLLPGLQTVAAAGLPNAIALLSGQAPNAQTLAGCPVYADVTPATLKDDGQAEGLGCVYPAEALTIANQLESNDLTWRAYVEDEANGGPGVATGCRHPPLGAADPWRVARPGDAYATARNPFVYFHAITDATDCEKNVTDLVELEQDLARDADDVPALSYIVPNLCHDGRAAPCAAGAHAGLASADAFLADIVPKIKDSKAYEESLVIITFERAYAAPPPAPSPALDKGGDVGALLVSPFVDKDQRVDGAYDMYSLLAMIEDIFTLDHLGRAGAEDVEQLSPSILEGGS